MPFRFSIDPDRARIHVVMEGEVTVADFQAYARALQNEPDFSPDFDRLVDLRRLTEAPSTHAIHALATRVRERGLLGTGRRAIVAGDPATYGMIRMLEILTDRAPAQYRAFRTIEDAEAWLDSAAGDSTSGSVMS